MIGVRQGARRPAHPGFAIAVGLAFALGLLILPTVTKLWVDLPEMGTIWVSVGLAAFVSVIVCPGWWGIMANVAGLTAYTTIEAIRVDFSGLHYVALAFMLPPVAVGACCGAIVNRVQIEGLARALFDPVVWRVALSAIVLLAVCLESAWILYGPGDRP